ncbi:hypothetical protein VPH35_065764 [Triticum aestivum]
MCCLFMHDKTNQGSCSTSGGSVSASFFFLFPFLQESVSFFQQDKRLSFSSFKKKKKKKKRRSRIVQLVRQAQKCYKHAHKCRCHHSSSSIQLLRLLHHVHRNECMYHHL